MTDRLAAESSGSTDPFTFHSKSPSNNQILDYQQQGREYGIAAEPPENPSFSLSRR